MKSKILEKIKEQGGEIYATELQYMMPEYAEARHNNAELYVYSEGKKKILLTHINEQLMHDLVDLVDNKVIKVIEVSMEELLSAGAPVYACLPGKAEWMPAKIIAMEANQ